MDQQVAKLFRYLARTEGTFCKLSFENVQSLRTKSGSCGGKFWSRTDFERLEADGKLKVTRPGSQDRVRQVCLKCEHLSFLLTSATLSIGQEVAGWMNWASKLPADVSRCSLSSLELELLRFSGPGPILVDAPFATFLAALGKEDVKGVFKAVREKGPAPDGKRHMKYCVSCNCVTGRLAFDTEEDESGCPSSHSTKRQHGYNAVLQVNFRVFDLPKGQRKRWKVPKSGFLWCEP